MKMIFKSKDDFNKVKMEADVTTWFDCLQTFQQFLQASGFIIDNDFDLPSVVMSAFAEHIERREANDD